MKRWFGDEHANKDKIGRWVYDARENRCRQYGDAGAHPDTDGGCVGTGNNFETEFLCDQICQLR